jgi:hypothetical protein
MVKTRKAIEKVGVFVLGLQRLEKVGKKKASLIEGF